MQPKNKKRHWKHRIILIAYVGITLNGLENILYNKNISIKEVQIEDTWIKKFIVGRFLDYKMVDSIPVVKQLEDLQVIINQIHVE